MANPYNIYLYLFKQIPKIDSFLSGWITYFELTIMSDEHSMGI